MPNQTQADVGVEFKASAGALPAAADILNTTIEAVKNPENNFTVTINADTIKVIGKYLHLKFHTLDHTIVS